MTLKSVYLRRTNKIMLLGKASHGRNFQFAATLDANLRRLGYALDDELALNVMGASETEVKSLEKWVVPVLKEAKGVRRYAPMYPNFPTQVMEATDAELYFNAMMHYFGNAFGLRIMPVYDELKRPELDYDSSRVTLLGVGHRTDALAMVNRIFMQTAGFGNSERDDIKSLSITDLRDAVSVSDEVFPNRENRAWLNVHLRDRGIVTERTKADTATDVLRLAVAMSGGDVSLAENTKFSLSRPERTALMNALAGTGKGAEALAEDMLRHATAWKRLGERLHPGEFKGAHYRHVVEAFGLLRSGKARSFNSKVEASLKDKPLAASLLSSRPGEFARRLDSLLRGASAFDRAYVLSEFDAVADKASPTVLWQVRNHFLNREVAKPRVFFPKGSVAKMKSIEDKREIIHKGTANNVVKIVDAALAKVFSGRESLGKVWVDPALDKVAVPFGVRSASKALKTLGRGSRLPLGDDAKVIRFFIWWKDAENDVTSYGYHRSTDIDLSAVVLDENFRSVTDITYYNLRGSGAVHSGDITSAPNGASEFIDIDIEKMRKSGGRYVLMSLLSYSHQPFVDLPECFAGFMERRDLDSGEIYDPRTVTNKVDVTASSQNATPFIFDLETREAIWVDLSQRLSGVSHWGLNVASNKDALVGTVEAMTSLTPPSLGELMLTHAKARGKVVADRSEADFVFAEDGDFSPYETERVLSELL